MTTGDPVVANILKTGAIVWTAPLGTALPSPDSIGAGAAWGANWERVGFTKDPVAVGYDAKYAEIKVQEYLAAVDNLINEEAATLETVLAEVTGSYLKRVFNGTLATQAADPTHVGLETVDVGNTSVLEKRIWGFEGIRYDSSSNALPLRFFILKGVVKLNGNLQFTKKGDDFTGIPMQIKAMADDTNSGRIIKIQRVTAPHT